MGGLSLLKKKTLAAGSLFSACSSRARAGKRESSIRPCHEDMGIKGENGRERERERQSKLFSSGKWRKK
jgi:hypothetical protein